MRTCAKIVCNILLSSVIYFAIVLGIQKISNVKINWTEILIIVKSPSFLIGLLVVIVISIILRRQQLKTSELVKILPPVIIVAVGFTLIILAYNKPLWENPPYTPSPYNPSVFGAGVSVLAIGWAFLVAFYPSERKEIDKLNKRIDRLLSNMASSSEPQEYTELTEESPTLQDKERSVNDATE